MTEDIFILDVTEDGGLRLAGLNRAEEQAPGFSSTEVADGFVENMLSEKLSETVPERYRYCLEVGTPIKYEEEVNLPIGRRYFHTTLIPVRNAAGRIHQIIGCCTDLTDARRAQQEALARHKLETIGLWASGIAHDFNNLLSSIIASAQLALAQRREDSLVEEELRRIRTTAIRGADMVRQLMVHGGKESPAFERVDLSALVEEMLQLLKVSVSKHAILKLELGQDLPAAYANPAQIRQVVMNLVTNASEAIGERRGVIQVITALVRIDAASVTGIPEGDYLQLKVSDTGNGMTPEVQARIFDPFFSTKQTGRGLGLAVTQEIIRAHGGAIHLVSARGEGTTFQIFLPSARMRDHPEPYIPNIPDGADEALASAGTILVVEDEDLLRLAISKMLRKNGFFVIETGSGSAALDLMRADKGKVDVVLLDATITGTSGREFFEAAQSMRPGVKIIVTSAYGKEHVDALFTGLCVERFIQKPFPVSDLIGTLRDALSA